MTRPIGRTLTWQLLKEVLSIYFVITILVTLAQMGIEYSHTRSMIRDELAEVERTFYPAISSALWEINEEQLDALQQGIIKLPLITRLKISDASGHHWEKAKGGQPLGESIVHTFRVLHQFSGKELYLAEVTFESSGDIVINRLKLGYQMIVIAALLKSTVLALLFFWVFRHRLGVPLAELTSAVAAINLDSLKRQHIDFKQTKQNELADLENAYNFMLKRLEAERMGHFSELEAVNKNLNHQVALRTRELELANIHLEALAHTDPLTGIANRRRLIEQAEQEIVLVRRTGNPLAMLMIDLDHFKKINDTHGHAVGDAVLRNFASVVSNLLRARDLIGRIGGEEFAVLLPETSLDGAEDVASRILEIVRQQVVEGSVEPVRYTVSIGFTCLCNGHEKLDSVMERADHALYKAKDLGRNQAQSEGSGH